MLEYEENLYKEGYTLIAGVDEVGRGPLVGPVVTAAVILPKNYFRLNHLSIDESRENKINLLYKDHLLAHKYLAGCTTRPDMIYANYDMFNG